MATWTPEAVREQLPDVRVLIAGREVTGAVRNRRGQFAVVCTQMGTFDVAWSTLAKCLTEDRPVRF